ncbi:MAG: capsular biosynthesis protein [Edwardsiella sp. (in: enterobacteria)]
MNLLRGISTLAGSSVLSQLIGALSLWLVSHRYGMSEIGTYGLMYSMVLIGAQVSTFASQLLIPRQTAETLGQNVAFCLLQSLLLALPYALLCAWLFQRSPLQLYLLTWSYALVLIAENLCLRDGHYRALALQRLAMSGVVVAALLLTRSPAQFYWGWTLAMLLLMLICLLRRLRHQRLTRRQLAPAANLAFARAHWRHLSRVGSAEVLAMANNNLPIILINFWFSSLTAGYFAIVSRFCLAPVMIAGNAVRSAIFSRWSADFRQRRFNAAEYRRIRLLLLGLGGAAVLGVATLYPPVMHLGLGHGWADSIPTARYMLPYLFAALAISPLTVIELIFGSHSYFLRIQLDQLAIILLALLALPALGPGYGVSLLLFSSLTLLRYGFIFRRMNRRAQQLRQRGVTPCA